MELLYSTPKEEKNKAENSIRKMVRWSHRTPKVRNNNFFFFSQKCGNSLLSYVK
jgi:hypothetical protein